MAERIGIIGGGSWATSLAILLSKKNYKIDLWVRDDKQSDEIKVSRENIKYLPGVVVPESVNITNDLSKALKDKNIILMAVPSHAVRETLEKGKSYIKPEQIIVNVAKGIENNTLLRLSQVVAEILPQNKYAILSGPSHAEEVAIDIPTTVVAASDCKKTAKYVQDIFIGPKFRV